jgi:uncharacterized protein (TIGR00730 family)
MERPKLTLAAIEEQIKDRLAKARAADNEELLAELILTVLKLAGDKASRGDLKILSRALKELRHAFRIFAPYRSVRKVSIFGSARVKQDDAYYHLTRDLARRLAEAGFMIITGAGPGIMQAGHEGAGQEKSFGVNIRLPSAQQANQFIRDDPKLMSFHFFFTRKLVFVKEADAVIIFPGGFGTHDELLEAITLAQTGKSQLVPILLMDLPDGSYWKEWQEFLQKSVVSRGYVRQEEMTFFKIIDNADAAVREIETFYRNYHSYRFVKQDLVIRLNHPPTPGLIATLNQEFAGILTEGKVRQTEPLPDELNEPDTLHLPRLLARFNRGDFARLRQMIDVINRQD